MACNIPGAGDTVFISGPSNQTNFPSNSSILYVCQHNLVLESGNLERTCINGSMWTGNPPVCIPFQVQLMNRTKYVAGGIAGSALLLGVILFLDFCRFVRKKMKIKRHTQRRLFIEGSQRPLPFLKLNPSILKGVYNQAVEGYNNDAYEECETETNSGLRKKKKSKKKSKESKNEPGIKEGLASFQRTNMHFNFSKKSKKRNSEVKPMKELDQSMQKVLAYDTSTTAYDSSTTLKNQKSASFRNSKRKKKKKQNDNLSEIDTAPQYYNSFPREQVLIPQPYRDTILTPRTQKQKYIAAATIPPYPQHHQQEPVSLQQKVTYVNQEMPGIEFNTSILSQSYTNGGVGDQPGIEVGEARPLPQLPISNTDSAMLTHFRRQPIEVEISRQPCQEIQV